jgi:hypothetical protein
MVRKKSSEMQDTKEPYPDRRVKNSHGYQALECHESVKMKLKLTDASTNKSCPFASNHE